MLYESYSSSIEHTSKATCSGSTGLLALLGASWGSVGPSRVPLGTLWVTLGTLVGASLGPLGGSWESLGGGRRIEKEMQKKDATQ